MPIGFGKLLRRTGREDIVYPGHEDLPDVPLGTNDVDWMPVVAARALIVVTRDRRIRTRPAELAAYLTHGIRSIWIGGKRDLGPKDQLALFLRMEPTLEHEIGRLGTGPWALSMTASGLRELKLRPLG